MKSYKEKTFFFKCRLLLYTNNSKRIVWKCYNILLILFLWIEISGSWPNDMFKIKRQDGVYTLFVVGEKCYKTSLKMFYLPPWISLYPALKQLTVIQLKFSLTNVLLSSVSSRRKGRISGFTQWSILTSEWCRRSSLGKMHLLLKDFGVGPIRSDLVCLFAKNEWSHLLF